MRRGFKQAFLLTVCTGSKARDTQQWHLIASEQKVYLPVLLPYLFNCLQCKSMLLVPRLHNLLPLFLLSMCGWRHLEKAREYPFPSLLFQICLPSSVCWNPSPISLLPHSASLFLMWVTWGDFHLNQKELSHKMQISDIYPFDEKHFLQLPVRSH